MKRSKPIQIIAMQCQDSANDGIVGKLIALHDDGSIWCQLHKNDSSMLLWRQISGSCLIRIGECRDMSKLSLRARNVLRKFGHDRPTSDITVDSLLQVRGCGKTVAREICDWVEKRNNE